MFVLRLSFVRVCMPFRARLEPYRSEQERARLLSGRSGRPRARGSPSRDRDRIELIEQLLQALPLWLAKAVERLDQEVIADARDRERALDALDDGGAVSPYWCCA